jgi:uncharacterized protein (DUF1499 family)
MRLPNAAAIAIGAAAVIVLGWSWSLERVWTFLGPPDLGPVAFETLERRTVPNDALACPEGLCRAKSDMTPPVYAVDAESLKAAMARAIATEPDVRRVASEALSERFVQRTRWMRFPDTVVVRYLPQGEGRATLAFYSRSQVGKGDLGVNRARIARWLEKLSAQVPAAR